MAVIADRPTLPTAQPRFQGKGASKSSKFGALDAVSKFGSTTKIGGKVREPELISLNDCNKLMSELMSDKLRHDVLTNQRGKGQLGFVKFTRDFLMRFHGQKVLADKALQVGLVGSGSGASHHCLLAPLPPV